MKYQIVWSDYAQKKLRKLEYTVFKRIVLKVGGLSSGDFKNVKKLIGKELYRLRVGDYRVIFRIINNQLVILVIDVAHQRKVYKRSPLREISTCKVP